MMMLFREIFLVFLLFQIYHSLKRCATFVSALLQFSLHVHVMTFNVHFLFVC